MSMVVFEAADGDELYLNGLGIMQMLSVAVESICLTPWTSPLSVSNKGLLNALDASRAKTDYKDYIER